MESAVSLGEQAVRRRLGRIESDAQQDVRRLLDTARELMQAGTNPRVADIVKATGLSNDAFYRYFKTKDDLVAAIVDDGARRLIELVERRMGEAREPERQVRLAVQVVMKQAADPAVALATRNVFGSASRNVGSDRAGKSLLEQGIATLLAEPLERLGARDPGRDSRTAGLLLIAAMNHFLWLDAVPTARDIDHLAGFLLRGCGIEP
jgi:AcrR family transcriptional regulator